MLLTPLGILAAGAAWGEWSARDFASPEMRQKIAAASGNVAPPAQQPQGLERLSTLWSAPFPQYAPPFVRGPAFGYVMSAMFGSGLILGIFCLIGWLGQTGSSDERITVSARYECEIMSARSRGVVERNLSSFVDALQHTFDAEELAKKKGLLQVLDPRIKIAAILPLIVIAALARQLRVIVVLFAVALAMALLSKVPLGTLAKRVWLAVLAFTGVIALPALFLTPGQAIYRLPLSAGTLLRRGFVQLST